MSDYNGDAYAAGPLPPGSMNMPYVTGLFNSYIDLPAYAALLGGMENTATLSFASITDGLSNTMLYTEQAGRPIRYSHGGRAARDDCDRPRQRPTPAGDLGRARRLGIQPLLGRRADPLVRRPAAAERRLPGSIAATSSPLLASTPAG